MKPFLLCLILLFAFLLPDLKAQTLPEPRQSPIGMTRLMIDDCYVKVVYGRPSMRDRSIFGSLVPYGEVWRTGANEATEITTTANIRLGGQKLEAGTYSIFTIPGREQWEIIINEQLGQWGSYTYDASRDVFRLTVDAEKTDNPIEIFTILLETDSDNKGKLTLEWENTRIRIPIENSY